MLQISSELTSESQETNLKEGLKYVASTEGQVACQTEIHLSTKLPQHGAFEIPNEAEYAHNFISFTSPVHSQRSNENRGRTVG